VPAVSTHVVAAATVTALAVSRVLILASRPAETVGAASAAAPAAPQAAADVPTTEPDADARSAAPAAPAALPAATADDALAKPAMVAAADEVWNSSTATSGSAMPKPTTAPLQPFTVL